VLFVPGFLSQVYDGLSGFALSGLDAAVRDHLNRVPLIGSGLAAAVPSLRVPIPEGTGLSFYTQERKLTDLGIRSTNIARPAAAGFNTQQSVHANAEAIKTVLDGLRASGFKRVVIVSHSKGGLDTLEALLTGERLWKNPVVGWVALQPPFFGSPVAAPGGLLEKVRAALHAPMPLAQALDDLTIGRRTAYMTQWASAINKLTTTIRIRSCYTTYQATPARNLLSAVSAGESPKQILRSIGLMDGFNRAIQEPNDGLVPMSSTRLPGVVPRELLPAADHAASVMLTAPLREFWTTAERDDHTLALLSEVAGDWTGPS